jgi:hypothetical protein
MCAEKMSVPTAAATSLEEDFEHMKKEIECPVCFEIRKIFIYQGRDSPVLLNS